MQTPKSRSGLVEVPLKNSSLLIARRLKTGGAESDPRTKTVSKTQIRKVVADRSSPRIPLNEIQKKRLGRIPELESQISQLQEELKKTKTELNRSETLKKEAQEEAQETKHQLMEINASEDSRIEELRKLSQERDKTWQAELEAMQRQHEMDSVSLSSAINEVQKLKSKLFEYESELKQSEFDSSMEVGKLKEDLNLSRKEIIQLKSAVEIAETRYKEEYIQSTLQIRNVFEQSEAVKSRFLQRETELTEDLNRAKSDIEGLLMDKKKEDEITGDLKKLEVELMEKEMELQRLRSEMEKKVESVKVEAMEGELRKVKIQCEQWRKAAETAASMLNNDEEKIDSIENGNMLKKFGVLLKKNHK